MVELRANSGAFPFAGVGAEHGTFYAQGGDNFGSTETGQAQGSIEPVVDSTVIAPCSKSPSVLHSAIEKCFLTDAHWLFFGTWQEKLEALMPAYELLLTMAICGEDSIAHVKAHPYFAGLKRRPSATNPALLAVRLITRPEWEDDHKIASDYAAMLMHAQHESVPPHEFLAWASNRTLRDCRKAIAQARRISTNRLATASTLGVGAQGCEVMPQDEAVAPAGEAVGGATRLRIQVSKDDSELLCEFRLCAEIMDELRDMFEQSSRKTATEFLLAMSAKLGLCPSADQKPS
ncbi:hypothetical protein ACVDG8_014730 [Mesorhizobium sp. ORM8.1]